MYNLFLLVGMKSLKGLIIHPIWAIYIPPPKKKIKPKIAVQLLEIYSQKDFTWAETFLKANFVEEKKKKEQKTVKCYLNDVNVILIIIFLIAHLTR